MRIAPSKLSDMFSAEEKIMRGRMKESSGA
jgi:hypothetical protein